ncbi:glycosyltransferase family 4 protein [Halodesulfovibrio marinisediminis]|uniref:Glycosyltransferase involved in cell wall bisynthesis n=1 Tax=Halodesulfovibrio marinisediminis DSM 17456 TaxID=1121457 RepID=A0A1N6DTB3_9BACT|nr:glycosyltransferase family 4 protein [Halodesulfovibrio marinisediminis]SIN73990.1 Glycosyltransferase involved in cell wall bisynthesis [Halodesulfovibrio marinisediminis DSM 17456]
MKTIQIINVRWFNATAWYGLYLARLLREAGHETLVITQPGTEADDKAKEWGFTPLHFDLNSSNPLKLIRAYAQLYKLIKEFSPDVVNCHRGEGFILWGLLRKYLGSFKLVRTRGDQRLPKNNLPNRWLHTNVADAVVATNSVMAKHFISKLHVPEHKVSTIFGGVDTGKFMFKAEGRADFRKKLGYDDSHFVVSMLGRFDEVKGQKELIEAVGKLYNEKGMKHLRLMLLGFETATSQVEVESWIADNNIQEITRITGVVPDVSAAISAMDLGVIASKWSETIARAAFEIMACKRPLISTGVGVMPDFMDEEAMFEAGSADALVGAIERAAKDEVYRQRILESQQKEIAELSEQHFLEKTLDLYSKL